MEKERENALEDLECLNRALCSPNVNYKITNKYYDRLKNYINTPTNLGDMENKFDYIIKVCKTTNVAERHYMDAINTIKQELSQRVIRADEIVKELNEWDTQNEWDYDLLRFYVDDNCYIELIEGMGVDFCSITLPLEIAHKITTFFTQQKEE